MIPIRVPADACPYTVGDIKHISADHPLAGYPCPVCDGPLDEQPVTLVHVGTHPDDRKPRGWTNGAAVAVHARCVLDDQNGDTDE